MERHHCGQRLYARAIEIKMILGLLMALMLWTLGASPVYAQARPSIAAGWQFTPLVVGAQSPPRWFTGTDGKTHLVYELLLTNAATVPATVSSLEVRDARSGVTLLRLDGSSLTAAMSLATSPDTPSRVIPPSTLGVVWLDVPLAGKADIPASVVHQLTIEPMTGVPANVLSFIGSPLAVDRRPPVVLGPPLTGAGWDALGSCCEGPHRRTMLPINGRRYLPQRFAIDFNQLDAQNRPGVGDPKLPASFPTFGQPVLAVADAKVVVAVDRYPDLKVDEPREALSHESEGGNRVVLDLGGGRYAAYGHLQSGSVTVKAGQRVRRGQPVAKAGSSGTDGGPHLHFQVMDSPSFLMSDGLPFVFDSFLLTGQTPPLAQMLGYYDTLLPVPIDTRNAGPRRNAFPLGSDVLTFPARNN